MNTQGTGNLNSDINNIFTALSNTSLSNSVFGFKKGEFSSCNKSESQTLNDKECVIKGFSYQEEKNLEFRKSMEDVGTMNLNLESKVKYGLFCIYDGHGGIDCVNFIKDRVPQLIESYLSTEKTIDINSCLTDAFKKIDDELKYYDSEFIGSTATVVLIINSDLYCANVGDSKGVILTKSKVFQISTDHKCTVEEEAQRIQKSGGSIVKGRVQGQLILSRTLGDLYVKKFGVTPIPSISKTKIDGDARFCVIASDGVWDVIDNNALLEMSKNVQSAEKFARDIVKTSIEKQSKDNISCIVISFIS